MRPQPFEVLLSWILGEFQQRQSVFGIDRSLFYVPKPDSPFAVPAFSGNYLATPIGPAAGPHTQLAQNIVSAWLCGGRFMELKTVQIMDELDIPRPCIDMEDEGYNVEWSQELKLEDSAREYIKAWVLIHILHRLLGFEGKVPLGTVFNLSVGYNLEGVRSAPITQFFDRMQNAAAELGEIRGILRARFPQFADIEIPEQLSNNVTLSTMHGCPPDEIEQIARYLLSERRLHTTVKLNPTLLGRARILEILHGNFGYHEIQIPDSVFEHDLEYGRAVELIRSLQQEASGRGLTFGVKLSNTLPAGNHKSKLAGKEMYLSGRALYPLTMDLFRKLAEEFDGDLNVSYAGGADALNVSTILACGALPVTSASDLLKPGGCARLLQYLANVEETMRSRHAASLEELARDWRSNLDRAAAEAIADPRYQKQYFSGKPPKVSSGLDLFDCVAAPCMEPCAVAQDVPEYVWLISRGEYDRALRVILARNPLPGVTGYVCTQLCRECCTRSAGNYDEPVAIRALKRFAAEKGRVMLAAKEKLDRRVAIIGSGPSGLAAAYFLALQSLQVTIFEAREAVGGMMRLAPAFRLPLEIIQEDVDRIIQMGVEIKLSHPITCPPEQLLKDGFDAVYIATGYQKDAPLHVEGMEGIGVLQALDFLQRVRSCIHVEVGARGIVIGGGDTALDAARVALRLTGNPVTVVYRRTRNEMPAGREDQEGAFEEGIILEELASPVKVLLREGRVSALACIRNRLGPPDRSGRRRPIPIAGSGFQIEADTIIVAVGQDADLRFLDGSAVRIRKNGSIAVAADTGLASPPGIYAGGDAVSGPQSIIAACAHGRLAAEAICAQVGIEFEPPHSFPSPLSEEEIRRVKRVRARREAQQVAGRIPPDRRRGFELIEATLTEEAARKEAARCVQCASFCDKCVEVCPNRANYTYRVAPGILKLPVLSCRNGSLAVTGEIPFQVSQSRQIIHLHDLCNDCGNCATFCVHAGEPFREKPRLFLNRKDFAKEDDNAFHLERNETGYILSRRENGAESRLEIRTGLAEIIFENELVRVVFSDAGFGIGAMELKKLFRGNLSLVEAAEMYMIANGVVATAGFLPLSPDFVVT
jgi:putative selenate reductase